MSTAVRLAIEALTGRARSIPSGPRDHAQATGSLSVGGIDSRPTQKKLDTFRRAGIRFADKGALNEVQ
jgi:hypothetical protein